MRSEEKLNSEILELQAKLKKLESGQRRAEKTVTDAKLSREKLSLRALTSDDKTAAAELKAAHGQQMQAQLRLEDIQSAIAAGTQQLNQLENERQAAVLVAKSRRYEADCNSLLADGEKIEQAFSALVAIVDEVRTKTTNMSRSIYGTDIRSRHKNLLKHMGRTMQQRLDLSAVTYFQKEYKQLYRMQISKLFERILNGAEELKEQNETETKTA